MNDERVRIEFPVSDETWRKHVHFGFPVLEPDKPWRSVSPPAVLKHALSYVQAAHPEATHEQALRFAALHLQAVYERLYLDFMRSVDLSEALLPKTFPVPPND